MENLRPSQSLNQSIGIPRKPKIEEYIDLLEKKIIPDSWDDSIVNDIWSYPSLDERRRAVIWKGSYILISKDWVEKFAAWIGPRRCLEIFAGHGMLSKALADAGVRMLASTDDKSSCFGAREFLGQWNAKELYWTDIETMDAVDTVKKYGKEADLILASWPPRADTVTTQFLLTMRQTNPDCLFIMFGEGPGESCADDSFFKTAVFVDDSAFTSCFDAYKTWSGIRDYPQLCR